MDTKSSSLSSAGGAGHSERIVPTQSKWDCKLITAVALLAIALAIGIAGYTGGIRGIGADGSLALICVPSILLLIGIIIKCCKHDRPAMKRREEEWSTTTATHQTTTVEEQSTSIYPNTAAQSVSTSHTTPVIPPPKPNATFRYQVELDRLCDKSFRIIKESDNKYVVLVRLPDGTTHVETYNDGIHSEYNANNYARYQCDGYFNAGNFQEPVVTNSRTHPQLLIDHAQKLAQLKPGTYKVEDHILYIHHNTKNQLETPAGKYEVFTFQMPSEKWRNYMVVHVAGNPLNYREA